MQPLKRKRHEGGAESMPHTEADPGERPVEPSGSGSRGNFAEVPPLLQNIEVGSNHAAELDRVNLSNVILTLKAVFNLGASLLNLSGGRVLGALQAEEELKAQLTALEAKNAALEANQAVLEAKFGDAQAELAAVKEKQSAMEAQLATAESHTATATAKAEEAELKLAATQQKLVEAEEKLALQAKSQKKSALLLWKAANVTAQNALARRFPEVAAKFMIEKEGMVGAAEGLKWLKLGASTSSASRSTSAASKGTD